MDEAEYRRQLRWESDRRQEDYDRMVEKSDYSHLDELIEIPGKTKPIKFPDDPFEDLVKQLDKIVHAQEKLEGLMRDMSESIDKIFGKK